MKRVVQCYSGGVGSEIARRLIGHPSLQLVGMLVHGEAKANRDIGSVIGVDPIGITTTRNIEDVIALQPDAAIWSAQGYHPEMIARLLEAGINVYTGLGGYFLDGEPDRELLESACRRGGSSFAAGGNIPGLISDVLPIFLSGFTGQVRCVTAVQRNHVADYPSAAQLRDGLGLGRPPGENEASRQLDAGWEWLMRISAKMVAAALNIPFTELRTTEKVIGIAARTAHLPASGLTIKAGTVGGVRWSWVAYSGDRPFLTIVNEQTAVFGLGDGWRNDDADPAWTVELDASPPLVATLSWPQGQSAAACNAQLNAARAINMIGAVIDAPPGCLSVLDLPMITCSDAMS
jgi:4-hydroxy-tetrahydrodipicolinate reductase